MMPLENNLITANLLISIIKKSKFKYIIYERFFIKK